MGITELEIAVINNKAPVTLADAVYIGDGTTTTVADVLASGAATTSLKHNFGLTGSVKFTINFNELIITNSTWQLCSNTGMYTQANTLSCTIPEGISNSNNWYYLISTKSDGYRVVDLTKLSTDSGGNIICAINNKTVYPIIYPIENLYVIGGKMYRNNYKSFSKYATIGDSISFSGCMDALDIPILQSLCVNGATIIGENSMCAQADSLDSDVELVTILGGTNDRSAIISGSGEYISSKVGEITAIGTTKNKTTFYGAYQYIIEKCYEINPNIKIMLCCPPRAWSQTEPYNEVIGLDKVGDLVKNVAKFYSLPYVDLYNNCPINEVTRDTYLNDKLHPNAEGCSLIGSLVKGEIKRCYCGQ